MALLVLSMAGVALLTGFATAITASAEHRNLASLDSSVRIAANQAIADVQLQAQEATNNPTTPNPFQCQSFTPTFSNLTGSYSVTPSVLYWNGTSFSTTTCAPYVPQQYTLTVSSGRYSTAVTTVIYDPSAPPAPNGVGAPTQLVWLQQPTTGVAGISITPQPEVAVEDSSNDIVTGDFSSVTLQQISGPGSLSNTCFGAESYGIVQFSGCTFSTAGTYVIQANDSGSGVASTSQVSVTVTPAPPAKLVVSTATPATASSTANMAITVTEEDAFGNPTLSPETVTLSTTSSGPYVFSTSLGGTSADQPTDGDHPERTVFGDLLLRRRIGWLPGDRGERTQLGARIAGRDHQSGPAHQAGIHV